MSITGIRVFIGTMAIMFAISGVTMGEMLFSDSYDTSMASSDVNFEIDSRTTGLYGGSGSITYNAFVSNGAAKTVGLADGTRKILQFDTPYTRTPAPARNYLWLDHNFNGSDTAGGLDLDLSAKMTVDADSGSTKWFAVAFGNTGSAASDDTNRPLQHGLTFIFTYNGSGTVRENNVTKSSFTWLTGGFDGAYHDFSFEVRGVDDDNPFDGVNKADFTVYVDGSQAFTYTSSSGFSTAANYIGLEGIEGVSNGDNTVCYFDDLTIANSHVVPEPSTLALLATGLIGLLAYAWKKRK